MLFRSVIFGSTAIPAEAWPEHSQFKLTTAPEQVEQAILAARNMSELHGKSPWLLAYAVLGPLVHAALALAISMVAGIPAGNGALLMVLAASASYIAVPAVIRHAIPEANPSLYFGMSLGLTFPFNILVGIPVYVWVAQQFLQSAAVPN